MIKRMLNLIFPSSCNICSSLIKNGSNFVICDNCWDGIIPLKQPYCPICARPFVSKKALSNSPEHICGICRSSRIYYTKVIAVCLYEGVLREAIHLFKYNKKISLAAPLGNLLYNRLKEEYYPADMIFPVPLHVKRLREREFNQSYLLGQRVGRYLNIPVIPDNLMRVRWTRPQVELNRKERVRNVKGVFYLRDHNAVKKRKILLIDDVYTTGSTVNECARVLKEADAKEVYVLILARMDYNG
ncbi:MAG: ComF family protein [Nitrospirota bacterium]